MARANIHFYRYVVVGYSLCNNATNTIWVTGARGARGGGTRVIQLGRTRNMQDSNHDADNGQSVVGHFFVSPYFHRETRPHQVNKYRDSGEEWQRLVTGYVCY